MSNQMSRQDKLDFLAQSISRAKKVMEVVSDKYDPKPSGNGRNGREERRSYVEDDYRSPAQNPEQYLTEAQIREINSSRQDDGSGVSDFGGGMPSYPQQYPQQHSQPQLPPPQPRNSRYDPGLYEDRERDLPFGDPNMGIPPGYHPDMAMTGQSQFKPYKNLNTSKMPKEILDSFLNKPMIDPSKPLGMEMDMDQLYEKVVKKENPRQQQHQPQYQEPQRVREEAPRQRVEDKPSNSGMDIALLEYVIKKTVEETLKQVSKQSNINENIQIKIGDQTFGGTIKTLKKLKTT